jgi:lipopolysaccharide export system permease protein
LFSVCSVYGRISADNEVLAVTAAGVSPMAIIKPVLIAGLLLSLLSVWLNDIALSWGRPGMNRVVMHSIEQVVYGILTSEGSYTSERGFSIHVRGIGEDGRELLLPTITLPRETGPPLEITAKSARIQMDPDREVLRIELVDSQFVSGEFQGQRPDVHVHEVSLSDAAKKGTASGRATNLELRQISHEIRRQQDEIELSQETLAARVAMGLATGKLHWLESPRTLVTVNAIHSGRHQITRIKIEPWRRWASGFNCLFFVWVGIPLAIWMRSADHWTSFGVCFLPILLVFFPVFAVGLNHAKDGSWPPIAVWLGNLVLLICGAWWLRRVYRG